MLRTSRAAWCAAAPPRRPGWSPRLRTAPPDPWAALPALRYARDPLEYNFDHLRTDDPKAARLWEAAIASAEPGSELARNLEGGVAEARSRAGLPPASAPAANAVAAATGASVSGEVQLAAALKGRASPEDTLFVFARAAEGSKMPLAIVRKQVKDLPLRFTLDDKALTLPEILHVIGNDRDRDDSHQQAAPVEQRVVVDGCG